MDLKKFIVITSIFTPTAAVKKFSRMRDFTTVVVGDKKSPSIYECENITFIKVDECLPFKIVKLLPYNHYSRKMIGYLYSIKNGADVIIDTDDDNIPFDENYGFPEFHEREYDTVTGENYFVNIYSYFTSQKIWPRGFPLRLINSPLPSLRKELKNINVGVWQALADSEPDVDAIYRFVSNAPCYFNKTQAPIVLGKKTFCPINSQNTAFCRKLFPLLYLPATVSFRFTDILRGLIAQPIMHLYDYYLGFTGPTVIQMRNDHDYTKDFESEIPCYLQVENVIESVLNTIQKSKSLIDNMHSVYEALYKKNIVKRKEIKILTAWLEDCLSTEC